MKFIFATLCVLLISIPALAGHPSNESELDSTASPATEAYNGPDYSGVYACKGSNSKVGDYELQAKLEFNSVASHEQFAVYHLITETENATVYHGQAIANGSRMALTFNIIDGRNAEYSTGIAYIKQLGANTWAYTNYYYEPDEYGGTYGSEYCVKQKIRVAKKPKKRLHRNA